MVTAAGAHRVEQIEGAEGRCIVAHVVDSDQAKWALVFHGVADCGRVVEFAAPVARAMGIGLVGVNRPGYGGTSPSPPGMHAALDDVRCVARYLGVRRYGALGLSGGGAFAAAAAASFDEVVALGIAAGIGPWRQVSPDRSDWEQDDVLVADLVIHGRCDEAAAIVREGCTRSLVPVLAMGDRDIAEAILPGTIEAPSDRAVLVEGFREALTTFDGVVYDNLTLDLALEWDPSAIRQPTYVWHGTADETVPTSNAEWFHREIEGSTLTLFGDEGHGSVVLGHFPEYLAELTDKMPS